MLHNNAQLLKLKVTSISMISESLTLIVSSLNNFHSLEFVNRVSEAQLQVSENSNKLFWQLKG